MAEVAEAEEAVVAAAEDADIRSAGSQIGVPPSFFCEIFGKFSTLIYCYYKIYKNTVRFFQTIPKINFTKIIFYEII